MSSADPRLAPVLAAERGTATVLAVVGGLMVLLGGAFVVLGITQQGDIGNTIVAVIFGLLFLVPGAFMIRKRLRGPEGSATVRLLTTERADLAGWTIEYVSINHGPTKPRIVLHRRSGAVVEVSLDEGEEGPVIAYVSELAPQIERRR